MTENPTRRDLMKPVQLLGFAFIAALFAGIVTLVSMGAFQAPRLVPEGAMDPQLKAWAVAGVVAGITFIVTLVSIALLMLAVDPAQIAKPLDRPVLMRDEDTDAAAGGPAGGTDDPASPRGH